MTCQILVADDSATIQKVLGIALSDYNVEITHVSSYAQAVRVYQAMMPDLLITGSYPPGGPEEEDFFKLLELTQSRPVLMLLGSYDAMPQEKLREAGVNQFLRKPFDPDDLEQMITKTIALAITRKKAVKIEPQSATTDAQNRERFSLSMVNHDSASRQGSPSHELAAAAAKVGEEQIRQVIEQTVQDYCHKHLKDMLKDVIQTELSRLARDKARQMVDN